jgi:hypothetical protein
LGVILGQGRIFENTVEVGGAELKRGLKFCKQSSIGMFMNQNSFRRVQ